MPDIFSYVTEEMVADRCNLGPRTIKRGMKAHHRVLADLATVDTITAITLTEVYAMGGEDRLADWVALNFDDYMDGKADPPEDLADGRPIIGTNDLIVLTADEAALSDRVAEEIVLAFWNEVIDATSNGKKMVINFERIEPEVQIENRLVDDLSVLRRRGHDVHVYGDETDPMLGRQMKMPDSRRRADLVCRDDDGNWLVIELKAVPAEKAVHEQVRGYMDSIEQHLARSTEAVNGLVISDGTTEEFRDAIDGDPRVQRLLVAQVLPADTEADSDA